MNNCENIIKLFINISFLKNIVNFFKITDFPLVSDRAKAIANEIGWGKLYEKSKEAQKK